MRDKSFPPSRLKCRDGHLNSLQRGSRNFRLFASAADRILLKIGETEVRGICDSLFVRESRTAHHRFCNSGKMAERKIREYPLLSV